MTDPQLARVKSRVVGSPTSGRVRFARSRVAIAALLATGGLMTTGGAAVGVSALSTELSAKAAQYGVQAQSAGTLGSGTAGATASGTAGGSGGGTAGAVATGSRTGGEVATATAQAPRQLEASGGSDLPFTGFAAIPMLLGGIALLATGLVVRRRTPGAPQS